MPYEAYVTKDYYKQFYAGNVIPDDEIEKALRRASRHIDSLTYNRIVGQGISGLTEFQQDIVREVICQQADFEYENGDMIDSVLSGYSLNGATVRFEKGMNIEVQNGIVMKKDLHALLAQTGLCCRLAVIR